MKTFQVSFCLWRKPQRPGESGVPPVDRSSCKEVPKGREPPSAGARPLPPAPWGEPFYQWAHQDKPTEPLGLEILNHICKALSATEGNTFLGSGYRDMNLFPGTSFCPLPPPSPTHTHYTVAPGDLQQSRILFFIEHHIINIFHTSPHTPRLQILNYITLYLVKTTVNTCSWGICII